MRPSYLLFFFPIAFQTNELSTIHTVIKELQDEAGDSKSNLNVRGTARKQELLLLIGNLESALQEVDGIVWKYRSLSRRERRIWDQLRFATEKLEPVRGKLTVHLSAVNIFMSSVSRGTLVQMERTLLELVNEVRAGRRASSIVPGNDDGQKTVWNELEFELAEDGISKEDVVKHKTAIRIFLQDLMSDAVAETLSLDEVASRVESSGESPQEELHPRPVIPSSRVPTIESIDTTGSEQYESAVEDITDQVDPKINISGPRIYFAQQTKFPARPKNEPEHAQGIDKRLRYLSTRRTSAGSIDRYRHSLDASVVDPKTAEEAASKSGQLTASTPKQMILIIDPTHSSISKLAHACLRSFVKEHNIVGEHIDTVRSTAWEEYESGGADTLSLDKLIQELLAKQKIDVPKWEKQIRFASFQLRDVVEFDHIIYFNSPSFRRVLEEHIEAIAAFKETYGIANKPIARLTQYDLLPSLRTPESMSQDTWNQAVLRKRQQLALEEIFGKVQRCMVNFLAEEFGLKKIGQGFEKTHSRRPSRSSPLPLLGSETLSDPID